MKYNLIGSKFGRLIIIDFHHKDIKRRTNHWICLCECGNKVIVPTANLKRKSKPTMSCGCYRYDKVSGIPAPNRMDYGKSNLHSLIWTYKKGAKNRNIEYNIEEDLFYNLTKSNCHYCNAPPSQKHSKRETYGVYIYNGIDRVNPNLGYISSNCVTCCKHCNYAKRNMSYEEFKFWITNVYNHFCNNVRH